MPKKKELIRVTKIEYTPRQYEHDAFHEELIVQIWGVNESGKRVQLNVKNTEPRIWVDIHPDKVNIPAHVRKYITRITKEGKSYNTGKPLYCIYLKYPYGAIVKPLRECFDVTYQADVPFSEAVRYFYGIKSYIKITPGKYDLDISEILPVGNNVNEIKTNTFVLDIETSDGKGFAEPKYPTAPILCLTLLNIRNGDVYHGTSADISERDNLFEMLKNKEWLHEAINHDNDIEPFHGKIYLNKFIGNAEEKERGLLEWLYTMINRLGITTIEQYGDYDGGYVVERIKSCNEKIRDWNKENNGKREYYPRHIFRPVNVIDIEKMYGTFIEGSVGATGRVALEWMSQKELGYGKIQRDGIDYMYQNAPEFLSLYNMWDCILPDRVMKKLGELSDIQEGKCNFFGTGIENWSHSMMFFESLLMHKLQCKEIFYSIRNVPRDDGMEAGGHVQEAPIGIYENMIELDNSGEYNAVRMTGNVDYKTLLKDGDDYNGEVATFPSGRRYRLDKDGMIPGILKEMTGQIDVYKKELKDTENRIDEIYLNMKDGEEKSKELIELEDRVPIIDRLKYILKSGSLAATGLDGTSSRFKKDGKTERKRPYKLAHGGMASDITEVGRVHEEWNKKWIESHTLFYKKMDEKNFYMILLNNEKARNPEENCGEWGCSEIKLDVIYQDTDSCKCNSDSEFPELDNEEMKEFLEKLGEVYSNGLNWSFDDFAFQTLGVKKHYFKIKVDGVYKKYVQWGAKKHYVWKDYNNQVFYRGVKIRKRDVMKVVKDFMITFFDIVMSDITQSEIISKVSSLIKEYESDILAGKYTIECGEPHGVHKHTKNYDSMLVSNSIFDKQFKMGDCPTFYPAKAIVGKPMPDNKRVALEYGDNPKDYNVIIDYDEVLRKLKKAMEKILKIFGDGINWNSLRDRIEHSNFEDDDIW